MEVRYDYVFFTAMMSLILSRRDDMFIDITLFVSLRPRRGRTRDFDFIAINI